MTRSLFLQLFLSPKTPARLTKSSVSPFFHLSVAARCESTGCIVHTFFPAVSTSCIRSDECTVAPHTRSQYFFYLSAISFCLWPIYDPRAPFCTHFCTDLSFRCMNKQCTSLERKESNKTKRCPPSPLAGLHFDNWGTFGSTILLLRSRKLWWQSYGSANSSTVNLFIMLCFFFINES